MRINMHLIKCRKECLQFTSNNISKIIVFKVSSQQSQFLITFEVFTNNTHLKEFHIETKWPHRNSLLSTRDQLGYVLIFMCTSYATIYTAFIQKNQIWTGKDGPVTKVNRPIQMEVSYERHKKPTLRKWVALWFLLF